MIADWEAVDGLNASNNWVDRKGGAVAVNQGGVTNSGGNMVFTGAANSHFQAPGSVIGGLRDLAIRVTFSTSTAQSSRNTVANEWWRANGLVGGEEPAVPNDFGLGIQDTNGDHAVGGAGGGSDKGVMNTAISVINGTPHTVTMTRDTATASLTVNVDGNVVSRTDLDAGNLNTAAGLDNQTFGLGAISGGGANPYIGNIQSIQIFNTSAVPEPVTGAFALLGGALLVRRRTR